jgi:hypothetical protein
MADHVATDAQRAREGERLYHAVFGAAPPRVVVERFIAAAAILESSAPPEERARYHAVLARVGDVEAIELAARYRRRLPLLSDHMRLLVYLAESVSDTQHHFVKRRASRAAAYAAVATGALRTMYKMIKGALLLARGGHV